MSGAPYFAHATACVEDGASIGDDTKIWHFSHIMKGTSIGKNCNIGQNVVIGPDAAVGNGCKIQNNVSVYKGVTLEEGVFCGPSMVFTNVFNPRANIRRMDEARPPDQRAIAKQPQVVPRIPLRHRLGQHGSGVTAVGGGSGQGCHAQK